MGNLRFGDIYTKDLDLVIQSEPTYTFPAKDVTVEHIPGRNGDLVIDNKSWQNVERVYSLASVFRPGTNFIENAEKIIKFLTDKKGYQRLEDSYDPNVFRMAQFKSNGALSNYYDQATVISVTFDCKPQRYLKDGEIPVVFSGSSAALENPTGCPALPIISISGIEHEDKDVFLVTVKNDNKVTSTITLSDVPSGDVIIDSELQTVSSIQNGDVNKYVSLNDKEFPSLGKGNPEVYINKYTEKTNIVEQYNLIISENKQTCLALYKPYDAIVETKQKSIFLKSYNLLKQQVQEVYEAKAYSQYCLEKANNYTFISFNTVMNETSQSFTFQSDYSAKPDWLTISGPDSNGMITVSVGSLSSFAPFSTSVAYFISNNDKVIRKLAAGAVIGTFKESTTVTISVYPASTASGNPMAVDYSDYDMPDWLKFEIVPDNDGSPTKIVYKSNKLGYFYLPKSGLFGKAGWALLQPNAELTSLAWNSSKKKFMPSGISTSTTASFEYFYLESIPQYEPTYRDVLDENGNVKRDANGNPIREIDNDVHFNVSALNNNITSIKYTAKDTGYYRCNDSDQGSGWRYLTAGSDIPASCGFVNTVTASNIVYFMAQLPTYDKIDGFPEWLNPKPILDGYSYDNYPTNRNGNPSTIDFEVLVSNWYRYTYPVDGNDNNTEWFYKTAGSALGKPSESIPDRGPNDNFTAYMVEGPSGEFPIKQYSYTDSDGHTINDIGFFYINNEGQQVEYPDNLPPSWLKVDVIPGSNEDMSDATIDFKANSVGSFNWDANTVWINKQVDDVLVTSSYKDDTSVNYLSITPDYPTTYPLFNIVVNKNLVTGNPESISFVVKQGKAGYFRAKTDSSWKYYEDGEEICNSKVSESTTIYNLEEKDDSLDNLEIVITPRWWSL